MQPPPYVSPFNDDTAGVPDGSKIYRLIRPDWVDWKDTTQRGGGPHIRKNAFQDYSEEDSLALGYEGPCMSIAVGKLLDGLGHDPATLPSLTGWDTYGVAILDVQEVRAVKSGAQGIQARPEPKMPWHGIVFGLTRAKKNPPIQRELAAIAEWVVLPVNTSPE
jgi:hypothetical protein